MSHPARGPHSGIDGQANAAGGRRAVAWSEDEFPEAERMSHPARGPRSGIDGQANAAGGRRAVAWNEDEFPEAERMSHPARGPRSGIELWFDQSGLEGVATGTTVRPGRGRTQPKSENTDKVKSQPPASRKKSPAARKAPARGRYVDEYACPF